ncbi:hypothetical protein KR009_001271 [Drosophila setifemur]|nr:hypothetical protein KR009_001271 [Drosophila setifemur]
MDIAQVCRICANKIKDLKRERNIFKYLRGKLLIKLKLITGVQLTSIQGLPEFICDRCFSELDLAVKFRERCIFSQKYLLDIKQKSKSTTKVRYTPAELQEQLIDAEQLVSAEEDEEVYVCGSGGDEYDDDEDPEASVMAAAEAAHQAEIKEQQLERAAKRRRNFFICDDCGQFFNNEYVFNEHVDAHQGRRETKQFFPCSGCPETFKRKALLKQHRLEAHGGDTVFKCHTCGEVFATRGDKLRHQKAHDNERPYPCLECGKIFSSVSELQEHSSTHPTTKRKYRCEPCDKDFLTRNDLTSHSKTQSHKRLARHMNEEIDLNYDS